jgi:tRNA A-37 threonylcarbamoyl transferase component Bud32
VLEAIPHEESLRQRLERAGNDERRVLISELLELVLCLHNAGWVHRDLYLEHVVLARRGEREALVLLDAGRARAPRAFRRRWLVKDLAALAHSAPRAVSRADRLRFLAGWLEGVRGSRVELRRFARAVERKRRRLARHAPLHADSASAEGHVDSASAEGRARAASVG